MPALAGVIVFIVSIGLITESTPAIALVVGHVFTDGLLVLAWLISAAGLGRLILRAVGAAGTRSIVLGLVTSISIGLGVIGVLVLSAGLCGLIGRIPGIAVLAPGWVTSAVVVVRNRDKRIPGWTADRWHWLGLLVVPAFAAAVLCSLIPAGILWGDEPHGYDVLEYHLQVPREWFEIGRIMPLEHNVFSYFPFGIEMHFLLAMELYGDPWRAMFLAQLMHVMFTALSVVAVYAVVRERGSTASAMLAAAMAGATPWLLLLAPVAYVEGGLLLYGALAAGWFLRAMRSTTSTRSRDAAVAGAMAGFACGIKLTALPMIVVALPVAAMLARPRQLSPMARLSLLYGGTALIAFMPWLVRTAVWTGGNPLFPEATGLFGRAHWNEVQVERWQRANHQATAPAARGLATQVLFDPRFGMALLPLSLAAAVMTWRRDESRTLLLAMLLMMVFWVGFTHRQSRFFVVSIPLAAILLGQIEHIAWRALVAAAFVVAVATSLGLATAKLRALDKRLGNQTASANLWLTLGFDGIDRAAQPVLEGLAPDATLVLIGDAQAYQYHRPMTRLRYRTVFDVAHSETQSILEAWGGTEHGATDVLLVDPHELNRFQRTYWRIGSLPAELAGKSQPFLLP